MLEHRPLPSEIPDAPGSYQFKDEHGRIIYVGKAKSLRARLSNYFGTPAGLDAKTYAMVQAAHSVEWIQVGSDVEALVLEYNLIKTHKPRYNVKLRDDKSYPMIALNVADEWPRAQVVRGKRRKGVRYFGPYPHTHAIRETVDLLQRTFPLRSCSDAKFSTYQKLGKPCLLYHIDRCSGPCIGAVSPEEYAGYVEEMSRFLRGDTQGVVTRLDVAMNDAAERLEFEVAARYRDRLDAVRRASERQEVVSFSGEDFDLVGYVGDELEFAVQIFHIRNGRLVGRDGLIIDRVEELAPSEFVERLVELFYGEALVEIPPRIYLPHWPGDPAVVETWLGERREGRVRIAVPQRGAKVRLQAMAENNAQEEFKRHRLRRASDHNARARSLRALQEHLGLRFAPLRIECYDMSHLQGTNYVGSMVVMEDGMPRRSEYRRFKVSTPQNDDFAAMEEVLRRRLRRLVEPVDDQGPPKRFAYPPNLVVVDGGRGQLSVAERVVQELGIGDQLDLCGLAKEFEEIYLPGHPEPVRLPRSSEALYLLQALRDEAHRFAITFHRSLRNRQLTQSVLDQVHGLGPKRREALLGRFGSITTLKRASEEEIRESGVVPAEVAKALYLALHPEAAPPRG
jgi:excinuclease ABC subunit C